MNTLPKISIIVPIYNVEKYIEECLNSVIEQTIPESIECILVDDCGSDNSVAIVEDFIANYTDSIEFTILHHEHNKGLSAARNTGTKQAKGDYVFFLDSDDKLFPNSILDLLKVAEKYPDAEIIQGCVTQDFVFSTDILPEYINNREWIRMGLCTHKINDPAWNRLIKRDFILNNNLFFEESYLQEDTLWSYQLQKHISAIAFCFELTYWYRYNPNGIMNGLSKIREAKSYARVFNYVFNDLVNGEEIKEYEIEYLIWNAKRVFGYIGKQEGNKLLVTQNNPIFNKVLKWSTGLSRIHCDWIRGILLRIIKIFILNPNIRKLCSKGNLLKNYTDIDYSKPV